ncbi:MAG: acetyl-CoA carboxylase, carboxyltransferase subunit beta [Candidatus Marinimicrobia bacterium]|nr:acetyl-CoA carboxylase, carboxyltransferase subunit beta [Candidatus Neomarinimicrobiota bacterium]
MNWFERAKTNLFSGNKKEIPDGVWVKCPSCNEVLYRKELDNNLSVCFKCQYHFRINSEKYLKILCDEGSIEEFNQKLTSKDPLNFKVPKKYTDTLNNARKKTGLNEAVVTVRSKMSGIPVVIAAMDFSFVGGSLGSAVGEKISRAINEAIKLDRPMLIISASGGARMQEGAFSLMQMAKTSSRLAMLAEKKLPYISILTNPTTGGVSASFSMLGDINIAEPGALIGFAGPRVIKQTIGQDLPEGFQTSEFLLERGMVDTIVARKELKSKINDFLRFYYA